MTRLGGRGRGEQPVVRLDDNALAYDVSRDGRSGAGRVQQVRVDRIDPSPYQVRLVFPADEVEKLADSILANGLIHEPRARPHPSRAGRYELMPGEMRIRALERLVERRQADGVLGRDGEGHWLVPLMVVEVDDERAEAIVAAENDDRTDLSAWEWARAYQARRERRRSRGQPAGVRDVAASVGGGKKFQTVGEYLQVADALTLEVLLGAGVVAGGEPDHARMARLPLAALQRVARAAAASPTAGAERLLLELKKAGDRAAAEHLAGRERALQAGGGHAGGFQVNIRQPLASLAPRQAAGYLARLAPAVAVLAERAADSASAEAEGIVSLLEGAARRLRSRDRSDS